MGVVTTMGAAYPYDDYGYGDHAYQREPRYSCPYRFGIAVAAGRRLLIARRTSALERDSLKLKHIRHLRGSLRIRWR
jgi:hypothetical protein